MSKSIHLRLTFDAVIDPNGVPVDELKGNLDRIVRQAINEGTVTGETEAILDEFKINVTNVTR
jgi:hypothetical protein